jgi:hypothetical protein
MNPTNELDKDVLASTTSKDDAAKSSDTKPELSDQEIASIAGGLPGSSLRPTATNTIPATGSSNH